MRRGYVTPRRNGASGFTMVELIMVTVIIAILATLAIPQFAAYRQKGYNSAAINDLGNAKIVLEAYFAENRHYP